MEEEGDKEEDEDMPFKSVEEARFEVSGKDLAEALKEAVVAFSGLIADTDEVQPRMKKEINLDAKMEETIAGDLLEQLLLLMDTEGFLPCCVDELSIEGKVLHCVVSGDDMENCDVKGSILSIRDVDVEVKKGRCKVTVTVEKGEN